MSDDTKSDEQKTHRFNMFLSPSEMKAIDEWAWANRIRSKSEAVRLLVQMGLLLDKNVEGVGTNFVEMSEHFSLKAMATLERLDQEDRDMSAFIKDTFDLVIETEERIAYLRNRLNILFQPYMALKAHPSFDSGKYDVLAAEADAMSKALQYKVQAFEAKKEYGRLPKEEEGDSE